MHSADDVGLLGLERPEILLIRVRELLAAGHITQVLALRVLHRVVAPAGCVWIESDPICKQVDFLGVQLPVLWRLHMIIVSLCP